MVRVMKNLPVVGKAHEAGPGAGAFHWFIYGSSLDREAFASWAEQHGYRLPDFSQAVPARLEGYRLAWNVQSNFWGGTVASLEEAPGSTVEGLALPLGAEARPLVDHKEGAISGLYQAFSAAATPLAGGSPLPVLAYRANPARRLPQEGRPSPRFLATIIQGARQSGLSPAYIASLEQLTK